MNTGTVYAVANAKGGVGKTTTAVNLGTALADDRRRVAIVDADLGVPGVADLVSLDPDDATLADVLAEAASVRDATYRLADGLFAVPGAPGLERNTDAVTDHLAPLVERLGEAFDVVLLDVGPGVCRETALPLGLADHTVLVTTPDPTAVRGAEETAAIADRADGRVAGAVCTRVRPQDEPAAVVESLPGDLLATIPKDDAVRDSIASGVPLVAHAPDSPAARAYRTFAETIAARLDGDPAEAGTTPTASVGGGRDTAPGAAADSGPVEADDTADETDRTGDVDVADLTDDDTDVTDLIDDDTGDVDVSDLAGAEPTDDRPGELTVSATVGTGEPRGRHDAAETIEAIDVPVEVGGTVGGGEDDGSAADTGDREADGAGGTDRIGDDIRVADLTDDDTDVTDLIDDDADDVDVSDLAGHETAGGAGVDDIAVAIEVEAEGEDDGRVEGDGRIVEPAGE